ncbi:hypothetical protein [Gracilimonas sp.]|uniref:hypothetical protein n=1 Tax=Gracilimonas sp. TaxID=1974203 RepID=UPI003BAAC525
MKYPFSVLLAILCMGSEFSFAQYNYEASAIHPYGQLNPEAPEQVGDFNQLIGESSCTSVNRAPDGSWNDPVSMTWTFKYIMNGMAVQDETLKEDGAHSGSIRQFNADSAKWYVHYYSTGSAPAVLPAWEGDKSEEGSIILYRKQAAPNGTEGFFRLTFSEITNTSF